MRSQEFGRAEGQVVRGGRAGSEAGPPHVSRLPNPAASDGVAAEQHPARAS
jgi:hypothetical protein